MVHHVVSPSTTRAGVLSAAVLLLAATTALIRAQYVPPPATAAPGAMSDGSMLLPNGWRIAPAGKHLALSTLPLNAVVSPDGRYAVITNNGLVKPSLTSVDLNAWSIATTTAVDHTWLGLAFHPDGTKLYASGAGQNSVQEFGYADGAVTRTRTIALPAYSGDTMVGGLAVSPDGKTLFATRVFAMSVSRIDLTTGQVTHSVSLPAEPYSCVISPDGRTLYVSLWGGNRVYVYDARSLFLLSDWVAGEHPNAMAISADGKRLFVACANSAAVWIYDTFAGEPLEQISTSLYPQAPPTSTPNSVALSPDGRTLIVANADNNAIAVIDVSNPARSFVDGFIPTGWYPTSAVFTKDGRQILILSGKGMAPAANMTNSGLERRMAGAASIVATPDRVTLADYTRRVMSLAPYSDATRLSPPSVPIGSPIPRTVGGVSPIKHVFYVIRENRTYDQVLGDLTEGNGDPKLTLFGRDTTPNAHALAQNFAVFDNFYVDADVSYNGHSYSTAAYATDFVEKMWQTMYARGGVPYLSEGGGLLRNPFGNISAPPGGYLWDLARRANVTLRSYGEFVDHAYRGSGENADVVAKEAVPGLAGLVAPAFAGWDLEITDNKRIDTWLQEFQQFERDGKLPQLSIVRLPNDHTAGTRPGAPTPRAMVAENDLALGRLVETISNSAYWKDSAIFVVEDDAQAGPDHVDSHRSVLLVASPFARRTVVDHTFYSTASVLRTIELILGLPPMSQYDAAATPMHAAFTGTSDLAPYRRLDPRVSLVERNPSNAFGAIASLRMNFAEADRTPEVLLNEIIWRSVKGADSPMPPPRRSLFITPASRAADDDDDEW
jgi:sugar lactone lactonase YvrE